MIRTTTRGAVDLVRQAERRGAVAVMVAPVVPELYAGRALDDVYGFYAEVAAAIALPLVLFNSSLTGVDLVPEFVARLARIPNVRLHSRKARATVNAFRASSEARRESNRGDLRSPGGSSGIAGSGMP